MARTGDILGYARVSTSEQSTAAQTERLKEAGALRTFENVISGKQFDRPGLASLIDFARAGDSHSVIQALIKQLRKLPKELYRSVTWDRGCEMLGIRNSP
ncbi:MAG: DNA invertase Pin-like site-specific DNA recombinase [Ascidiaceihabitans sp.]|jgi:DNA invertase Pin-like site-specific DNA recombinase